jgi:hypothetical protein
MTPRAKEILKDAINIYNAIPSDKKQELIATVQNNLKVHYDGLNNIGMGFDEDKVRAGEIWLRIFKN